MLDLLPADQNPWCSQNLSKRCLPMKRVFFVLLIAACLNVMAEDRPLVLGYGVKGCRDYTLAFREWDKGSEAYIAEYLRYRGWLAGLVTGLSLATGLDVLKGVELDGAMRRIQVYCDDEPNDDFFNASMRLIRALSSLS